MDREEFLSPARGARDFLPAEMLRRNRVLSVLRQAFQLHGFEPLETPALEKFEVLASKYAGGEEILKEVFKVTDQGGRQLGLRYDLTVPMCRVIAANPRMRFPFKRYQIAHVWRDGPLKAGRYREFVQCDADTAGAPAGLADAEIISIMNYALSKLFPGNFFVEVGNRKLLNGVLAAAGIAKDKETTVILSLDKLKKIGAEGVKAELLEKGIPSGHAAKLLKSLDVHGSNREKLSSLKALLKDGEGGEGAEGVAELEELFSLAELMGFAKVLRFNPSLARGLQYYTSTVFEAFLSEGRIHSSLAGGGRYDDIIGDFAGRGEKVPATGVSFGLDVIVEALRESEPDVTSSVVKALVFPVKKEQLPYALKVAGELRKLGVNTSVDLLGRAVPKNLEFASKQGVPFCVIVGEKEEKAGKITLRNMRTGEEKLLSAEEAAKLLH